jgi:chorismate-pyruvate lyase
MKWDILSIDELKARNQACPLVIRDILDWVFESASLTAKLRRSCGNSSVRCIAFYQQEDWVRDVEIYQGNTLKWLARTYIPQQTKSALQKDFLFDQKFPIGDFLFSSNTMKRKLFNLTLSPLPWPIVSNSFQGRNIYWVRKSVWYYENSVSLTVLEVF